MIKMKAFTVTEITRYLKRVFQTDPILNRVLIEGEISNFTRHSSGHSYFTLKDDTSKISCVLFAQYSNETTRNLKNGDKVHAKGQITLYERDGKYQLYVQEIDNIGLGALHIKFEQLKIKLEQMGYFDERRKKKIPEIPASVGVITSPTGAAVQDIISVANRRSGYSKLYIYPVHVQGEQSAPEIVKAIEYFNQILPVDVLILARGGGSLEELWSFNEEIVANAIFNSKIPIISGVGHETDFTISDFVSDRRAPTPSAAAEMAVKSKEEIRIVINKTLQHMILLINRKLELARLKLNRFDLDNLERKLLSDIHKKMDQSELLKDKINRAVSTDLKQKQDALTHHGKRLDALSPLGVLKRGYSVVLKQGVIVSDINQVDIGDTLEIQVSNGQIEASIDKIISGKSFGGENGN